MTVKRPSRNMDFVERDEDFIRQLARDIGCHYYKANERTYSLNRHDSAVHGERGIFAWVHKEEQGYFWIATRRVWVEETKARMLLHRKRAGMSCFPPDDKQGDSVCFDMRDGYDKTVRALKLVSQAH